MTPKFKIGQKVVATKSSKIGTVSGIYLSKEGVCYDVQVEGKARPWRYNANELMSEGDARKAAAKKQAEVAKAARAKAKAEKAKALAKAKAAKAKEKAKALKAKAKAKAKPKAKAAPAKKEAK